MGIKHAFRTSVTRAGAFGVALLAAILSPTEAAAEPLDTCDCVAVPTEGEAAPANLPAFLFFEPRLNRDLPHDEIWIRSLHDAGDVTELPFTEKKDGFTGGTMAVFGAPLEEGHVYEIVSTHSCSDAPANVIKLTHEIRVGAPAPLPKQIGTLKPSRPKDQNDPILLALDVAPEMAPWIHAALFDISVDGVLLDRRLFVDLTKGRIVVVAPRTFCPPRENALLDLEIVVRAHVAGAPEDPAPASVVAPISCKAEVVASPPTVPLPHAVVVDQGEACGCRAVGGALSTGAGPFLAGLSLLILRRRSPERPRRCRRLS